MPGIWIGVSLALRLSVYDYSLLYKSDKYSWVAYWKKLN